MASLTIQQKFRDELALLVLISSGALIRPTYLREPNFISFISMNS